MRRSQDQPRWSSVKLLFRHAASPSSGVKYKDGLFARLGSSLTLIAVDGALESSNDAAQVGQLT